MANQKGQALILSYAVMIFVIMILTVIFNLAVSDSLLYQRDEDRIRAESLAQAGVNFAINELAADLYRFSGHYEQYLVGQTWYHKCPLFIPTPSPLCPLSQIYQAEDSTPLPHDIDLEIPNDICPGGPWCLPKPNRNEGFRVRIVRNATNPEFEAIPPGSGHVYLKAYSPSTPDGVGPLGWGFFQYIIESKGFVWDRDRDDPTKKVKSSAIVQSKVTFLYFPHPLKWVYNTDDPMTPKWQTADRDPFLRTSAGWGGHRLGTNVIGGDKPPIYFTGIRDLTDINYPYGGRVIKPFLPPGFYNVHLTLNYDNALPSESIVVNISGRSVVKIDKNDMPPSTIEDSIAHNWYAYPNVNENGPHYPMNFIEQYGTSMDIPTGTWNNHDWGLSHEVQNIEYNPDDPVGTAQGVYISPGDIPLRSYVQPAYGAFVSFVSNPDPANNYATLTHDIPCTTYTYNPPLAPPLGLCPDTCTSSNDCFKIGRDFSGDLYIGPFCTQGQSCTPQADVPIQAIELTRSRGHGELLFGPAPGAGVGMRAEDINWDSPYIEVYSVERINVGPFE